MRILIISDTHTDSIKKLPDQIIEEIINSDAVLHAGDIVGIGMINEIRELNPEVYAVAGNMDPVYEGGLLPEKRILEFGNFKIGLTHGYGSHEGIENRISYMFDDVDIIVYGHTHKPLWQIIANQWFLNPGSVTKNRYVPFNTYAILEINKKGFQASIKKIEVS